jgi:hypothetical protein
MGQSGNSLRHNIQVSTVPRLHLKQARMYRAAVDAIDEWETEYDETALIRKERAYLSVFP